MARFTCDFCTADVDAEFRYLNVHTAEIAWDCPECGRENDGEIDEDPDRWRG